MQLNVTASSGQASESVLDLSDDKFGAKFNESLVHQVVTAYMAAMRSGTHAQKNRAQVSGGGTKPWRQKGTGRARAGTIRSPLWRSGGVTFAARPRDYSQKVNRKMYRGAMCSIFSELIRQERLIVVDGLTVAAPKTKELVKQLQGLGLDNALIVTDQLDDNLALAARNLYWVDVMEPQEVDPLSLVRYEKVVATVGAMKQLEERLS